MVTAATRLAAVQELLLLLAQHAFYSGYMDALRAMRLVSRVFHAAATPYHFMELRIDSTLQGEGEMEKRLTAPLDLVRHLYLDRYKNWPGQEEWLRRVLSSVPRLERFRCESHGSCLPPLLLRAVATTCPRLESLQLTLPSDYLTKRDRHRQPDLDCFSNLRELSLHNLLIDDHEFWLPQIVRLLKNSQHLQVLKLGFSAIQSFPDYALYLHMVSTTADLFDQLCDLYSASGGAPLRLSSLWLLGGLVPYREDSLPKLADPARLVDVLLSNRERRAAAHLRPARIALDAVLDPARAPRLRWFRVDECSPEILEHLHAAGDRPWPLAVSHRQHPRIPGLEQLLARPPRPSITGPNPPPALQLRMLALDLEQPHPVRWSSPDTTRPRSRRHRPPARPPSAAAQILDDLVSSSSAALVEGLAVRAPSAADAGGSVEERVRMLRRALARLPRLAQLSFEGGPVGVEEEVLAEGFARAAPGMRFVHVGGSLWGVWRGGGGGGKGEGDRDRDGQAVVLEAMDPREADSVELWRHSLFNLPSVMPMYHL